MKELILRGITKELRHSGSSSPRKPPTIPSKRPGSLYLDNEKIYELIDFP